MATPPQNAPQPSGAEHPDWLITRIAATGSTNADLVAAAHAGAPDRSVLLADVQLSGRGRMGRSWVAPAGTALMFSALIRTPALSPAARGWIGAIAGLAVCAGVRAATGLDARLKWPNDVLIGSDKLAGILAELVDDGVVVGVGLNVSSTREQLPRVDATSLALAGAAPTDCARSRLLEVILAEFDGLLSDWLAASGDVVAGGILTRYRAQSATIGVQVALQLPGGRRVSGRAVDVAPDGSLLVEVAGQTRAFLAADVTHLRVSS